MVMAGLKNEGSSAKSSELTHEFLDTDTADTHIEGDEETEYPVNTKPLENQVAGHEFKDGKRTIGMLKHKDGYVLKPVNLPVQGGKEIKFYEDMQVVKNPLMADFKKFIPNYYGTTVLELQGKKITFLLLEDITNGFQEPCVMDLKIGRQTWEPGAPIEKQLNEKKKYIECKKTLHFCIPGFQTYDFKTGVFKRYGKCYGKQLNAEGVHEAFRLFFNDEHGVSEDIVVPMLYQLKEILKWWKKQNVIHIYSSSVLLAYDASGLRNIYHRKCTAEGSNDTGSSLPNCNYNLPKEHDETNIPELKTWLRVCLIDFAHVLPAENGTPDRNYINGITSLINVFENLLNLTTSD